jgi:hypothetical protein
MVVSSPPGAHICRYKPGNNSSWPFDYPADGGFKTCPFPVIRKVWSPVFYSHVFKARIAIDFKLAGGVVIFQPP